MLDIFEGNDYCVSCIFTKQVSETKYYFSLLEPNSNYIRYCINSSKDRKKRHETCIYFSNFSYIFFYFVLCNHASMVETYTNKQKCIELQTSFKRKSFAHKCAHSVNACNATSIFHREFLYCITCAHACLHKLLQFYHIKFSCKSKTMKMYQLKTFPVDLLFIIEMYAKVQYIEKIVLQKICIETKLNY